MRMCRECSYKLAKHVDLCLLIISQFDYCKLITLIILYQSYEMHNTIEILYLEHWYTDFNVCQNSIFGLIPQLAVQS